MIEIKITEPHLLEKDILRKTATFLFALAGDQITMEPLPIKKPEKINMAEEIGTVSINPFQSKPTPFPELPKPSIPAPIDPINDVDIRGLPWDYRIHARGRTKNAKGEWKISRGVNPDLVTKVEAELFQSLFISKIPQDTPSIEPTVVVPPPPLTIEAPKTMEFPEFMSCITSAVSAGKIQHEELRKIAKDLGLPSLPIISTRPDLIPQFMTKFNAIVGSA